MDPLSHKLAEFPFQIGGGGSRWRMLDQLKGARVELKLGTETVTGAIVSARTFAGTDKQPERDQLNLMLDSGELRTVDLGAATGAALHRSEAAAAVQGLPGGAGQRRAPRRSAASTSIPPTPGSATSPPAT